MKQKNIELHNNCQCELRYRQFKGKIGFTAGLFCKKHDVFLDWLKDHEADHLIDLGITVAPYIDRKQAKKTKRANGKFYQRAKQLQQRAKAKLQ